MSATSHFVTAAGGGGGRRPPPPATVLAEWAADGDPSTSPPRRDATGWEPTSPRPRRSIRRDTPRGPRDEFVRPIIDAFGVGLRLGGDVDGGEDALADELDANRQENETAASWAITAVTAAAVVGFTAGHVVGRPLLTLQSAKKPDILAPSPAQRAEGGRVIQEHMSMLQLEAALGKMPPLSEDALVQDARAEATALATEFRDRNERALVDLASDSAAATVGFAALARPTPGRAAFFGAVGRVFSGLSDTAKAFLIIASTDVFLGYHSEEGWTAAIHLVTGHYNFEPDERGVALFIATVPVAADAVFKLWIFKGLNRANPSAAVTLKQMDRH